ncbi:MAG: competence/damage-inducible protein A, partial [Chloroflexi bacterium]
MRAAILSIGSELMQGFLTDTNATFLTQELSAIGVDTVAVFQVGDNLDRIVTMFRRALDDADIVIASGGIGPTEDDLTREAIAAVCAEEVYVNENIVEDIRSFFASRGIVMPDQNVKQAWLIPSAESLANPMGTAPGWFVRHNGKVIACMPGVPREMRRMFLEQVVPRILPLLSGSVIVSRTLKTIGIGESAAEQAILDIIHEGYPVVATYAKNDGVHIRITAVSESSDASQHAVDAMESRLRERIGQYVYGYLEDSLAA